MRSSRNRSFTSRSASIWLAVALGLSTSLAAHAVQDCELDGTAVNPANGDTTRGKTGLMRCRDRDSGQLEREQELRNGSFMGVVRHYSNGRVAREYSVDAKGNMNGRSREFYPGGQLRRDAVYEDGHVIGLARSFHLNGQLRRGAFHADPGGERAAVEFTESGQLASLRCGDRPLLAPVFDDARLCGFDGAPSQVELFDARGGLRARITFVDGKRVRGERFYDNGRSESQDETVDGLRTERRFSSEGVRRYELVSLAGERTFKQRELEYSERGTLVREQRWSPTGQALADETNYLNGQPRSRTIYSGEGAARIAEVTEFQDNGQRATQGRFSSPAPRGRLLPIGAHRRFDERGRMVAESVYDDKGRLVRERAWNDDGTPVRDDEVFEDGSRKVFAR
ncbi:MAG: hypothetical protein ACRYGA_17765 [Janthinobacterium lividum]